MQAVWDTLYRQILGQISLSEFLLALSIFVLIILLRRLFTRIVLQHLKKLAMTTSTDLDDKLLSLLEKPIRFALLVIALNLSLAVLSFPTHIDAFLNSIIRSMVAFVIFWALYRCIDPFHFLFDKLTTAFGRELTEDLKIVAVKGFKLVIVIMGGATILNEWGISVVGIMASLGLVGMAVALAAKDMIANLFGSLTIFLDKTFKKGDWIMTPDVEGTVENIGIRATKIRTFANALVTIPNATLANSAVTNWSRMKQRRIQMTLSLEYRTTRAQVEKIMIRLREYLENHPDVVTDRLQSSLFVHLVEFNDSSIDLLLYYFTKTVNWGKWMQIREDNMLMFMRIIEEEGAAFAFPSQSLYIETLPKNHYLSFNSPNSSSSIPPTP